MSLLHDLNALAQQVTKKLFRTHPEFRHGLNIRKNGELEASLSAPRNSHAGYLVVFTNKREIWMRLSVPHAFYLVDDTSELIEIINGLLSDNIFFVIVSFRNRWLETTLVRRNGDLRVDSKSGTVRITSWSGKHDKKFRLRSRKLNQTTTQPATEKRGG